MAQLVARFHGMEEVRGSNPLSSTLLTDRVIRSVFYFRNQVFFIPLNRVYFDSGRRRPWFYLLYVRRHSGDCDLGLNCAIGDLPPYTIWPAGSIMLERWGDPKTSLNVK